MRATVICWNMAMDRVCIQWPTGKLWHNVHKYRFTHAGREWFVGTSAASPLPAR